MKRSTSLNVIVENLLWLIGSLMLAIFVWIAATTEQNPVEVRRFPQRIPIEIVTDEGTIVTNTPNVSAQIILRTQAEVWEILDIADINIRADLTGLPPGTYTLPLQVDVATTARVVVENLQPNQITVSIDQAAEILVPIEADIRSEPPTGFEMASITFATPEVRITGPAAQVQRVVQAEARVHLRDDRNPTTREMRLYPVDEEGRIITGVTLSPEIVDASINIQPREDFREVFVTPNILGEPADGYVIYSITYEPQTVLISGRPSELEKLPGSIQTAPVDLTDRSSTFAQVVNVSIPDDLNLLALAGGQITVRVEIDTLTASRRFERLPIVVQGLSDNLEATITPSEVTMLITGPQPILDTLQSTDISILADLTDLEPGGHQVTLQAIVNRQGLDDAVISVLPAVLDVQIKAQADIPADNAVQP